ncbi:MAG: hypothetical protein U0805_02900 [Pirellulales bacterium]
MRSTDLWPKCARVIEIGATSGEIGHRLTAAGYHNYLAVTSTQRDRDRIVKKHPGLKSVVATALATKTVRQNNAEVLVLDSWAALAVWQIRSVRHAKYVAIKLQPTPLCWISLLLAFAQCLLYRFAWPTVVNCARTGAGPWLVAFRVRQPHPYNAVRRFVPHRFGIDGLLQQISHTAPRHAVLRWFEQLPQVPAGEDLDLMVSDDALDAVRKLCDDGPGIQPIDLYSVTGLPGADFRSMPYYPPHLAEQLLDHAASHHGLCRVPSPREHFLSLAYHVLYHKGYDSGLPANATMPGDRRRADHDYVAILKRLASACGTTVEITLEALDSHLDIAGWRPPHDMLIRLARRNRWIKSLLKKHDTPTIADDRIAVFLVREEALRRGGVARAAQLIEHFGFEIRATETFDRTRVPALARTLRGGNWGPGPWPTSGGPPVAAIVAFDSAPITPTPKQRKKFPFIANARLLCKEQLRDAFNDGYPQDQHCNVIHSSDNGREALDYLRIIMPERIEAVLSGGTGLTRTPLTRAA